MPADFSVSLDGSRTFLKVHALEQRVFAVLALDGKRRLLQLSFPLECGLLCPPALLLGSIVGKQVKLLTPSRLGCVRFRKDVICHQIHAPDEQIRVDNTVEQRGRCVHELSRRRGQFSETLRAVCRFWKRAPVAIGLGLAVIVNPPCRIVQVINIVPDGQHKPEYIAPMLAALEEGNDIVIGSRFLAVKKPKTLRMLGSYIISWSIRLTTGRAICDPTSGMRMFNRAMVEEFAQNLNYGPEPDTISYLIKNGATVKEVQVEMGERLAGQSYLTFWRSVQYMVKMSISILLIQWFRKRDTETPYPERSL
jgi:hypothetical protein